MFYHIVIIISPLSPALCFREHLAYYPKIPYGNPPFSNCWPGSLPSSQYPAAEVVNFGTWFLFSFPISLIMLVVSWFWMHWLFLGCKWVPGPFQQSTEAPLLIQRPWHGPWMALCKRDCQVTTEDAQGECSGLVWESGAVSSRHSKHMWTLHFTLSSTMKCS